MQSIRVLPIYVLSLLGLDEDFLIDHRELAVEWVLAHLPMHLPMSF